MTASLIYGCADVAQLLRVTRAAISNYRARFTDTPEPAWLTTDGRPYWDQSGMREWQRWQANRRSDVRVSQLRKDAYNAVEELRKNITS